MYRSCLLQRVRLRAWLKRSEACLSSKHRSSIHGDIRVSIYVVIQLSYLAISTPLVAPILQA